MNYITRHAEGVLINDRSDYVHKTSINQFINTLAVSYLSTIQGRKQASKKILNDTYNLPFIVHETVLLFPTHAERHIENHYLNYHRIASIRSAKEGAVIEFFDGTKLPINRSCNVVLKQYAKAQRLWEYYECAKQKESVYIGVFPLDFLR
jgi:competence protein ComK